MVVFNSIYHIIWGAVVCEGLRGVIWFIYGLIINDLFWTDDSRYNFF